MNLFNINYTYKCFGTKQKNMTNILAGTQEQAKEKLKCSLAKNSYIKNVKIISCLLSNNNDKREQLLGLARTDKVYHSTDRLIWKRNYGSAV